MSQLLGFSVKSYDLVHRHVECSIKNICQSESMVWMNYFCKVQWWVYNKGKNYLYSKYLCRIDTDTRMKGGTYIKLNIAKKIGSHMFVYSGGLLWSLLSVPQSPLYNKLKFDHQ